MLEIIDTKDDRRVRSKDLYPLLQDYFTPDFNLALAEIAIDLPSGSWFRGGARVWADKTGYSVLGIVTVPDHGKQIASWVLLEETDFKIELLFNVDRLDPNDPVVAARKRSNPWKYRAMFIREDNFPIQGKHPKHFLKTLYWNTRQELFEFRDMIIELAEGYVNEYSTNPQIW